MGGGGDTSHTTNDSNCLIHELHVHVLDVHFESTNANLHMEERITYMYMYITLAWCQAFPMNNKHCKAKIKGLLLKLKD